MKTLDFRDSRPIYEQIVSQIRQEIATGILREGDQLPSVREMAGSLSINPNTIQRAYRELEAAGWIISVPGKGSFVCPLPQTNHSEKAHLLETFDQTSVALIELGVSPMELITRITQIGGGIHA